MGANADEVALYLDFEANDKELNVNSTYSKEDVENNGWYKNSTGTYCASIVNISESNYVRDYVVKAYLKISYADGTRKNIKFLKLKSYSGI